MSDESPTQPTASQRHRAREAVIQALYQWELSGYPMAQVAAMFRADNDLKRADIAFFHDALTAIDHTHQTLVDSLKPYLSRELSELTPIERNILLLGAYELSARIDIPFKVVISEAVALSKKFGATDGHKFVNGVLDQLAGNARTIEVQALGTRERV
ncbi:MAG: transcription antitermination factor NusB [Pseudomonadota bacterium]|nr:transcription antitermination factor NusB [Pseudomonadota bacterium]MEE2820217.1 transcription antitermination factor NusB [Pseudomonadota bacterium]